jgi:hypothetical protein
LTSQKELSSLNLSVETGGNGFLLSIFSHKITSRDFSRAVGLMIVERCKNPLL